MTCDLRPVHLQRPDWSLACGLPMPADTLPAEVEPTIVHVTCEGCLRVHAIETECVDS